ncbi:hypothetical protein BJY16_000909 [Actinoplanes octamycinicus]|uniref:PE family protein n=1 Tax=Actinoplanes octamycinicus TaxID=135948 RepID=A0A7W7GSG2_9ACTN|nr:hypothetical protein [Actinoplanes octamycinicus]MBB4737450.1 hypothetical protein [Actinoplanes octamycinicus]GIE60265.1 hypothetical protein Aoc01nite_56670 [Actinoplanes octamycinicus]
MAPNDDLNPLSSAIAADVTAMEEFAARLLAAVDKDYAPHADTLALQLLSGLPAAAAGFAELSAFAIVLESAQDTCQQNMYNFANGTHGFAKAAEQVSRMYRGADAFARARLADVDQALVTAGLLPPVTPAPGGADSAADFTPAGSPAAADSPSASAPAPSSVPSPGFSSPGSPSPGSPSSGPLSPDPPSSGSPSLGSSSSGAPSSSPSSSSPPSSGPSSSGSLPFYESEPFPDPASSLGMTSSGSAAPSDSAPASGAAPSSGSAPTSRPGAAPPPVGPWDWNTPPATSKASPSRKGDA